MNLNMNMNRLSIAKNMNQNKSALNMNDEVGWMVNLKVSNQTLQKSSASYKASP